MFLFLPSMNTALEALLQSAQKNKNRYVEFLRLLKRKKPAKLDDAFAQAHEEVFEEINCLDCANCCKTTGPLFKQGDIERAAKALKMNPSKFTDTYLRTDEDGDMVLQQLPCPFLDAENYCIIYENRPYACRDYPHTQRKRMHQVLNLAGKNLEICPAVAPMLDRIGESLMR